jgi:hypothetical protein
MKHLRRICGGFFLVLALSIPALAGDIHTTDTPAPAVAGDISCPGIAGVIGSPGINLILSLLF